MDCWCSAKALSAFMMSCGTQGRVGLAHGAVPSAGALLEQTSQLAAGQGKAQTGPAQQEHTQNCATG